MSHDMYHHLSPDPALRFLRAPVYVAPTVIDCLLAVGYRGDVVLYDYLVLGEPDRLDTEEDGPVTRAAVFDRQMSPCGEPRRLDVPAAARRILDLPCALVWRHMTTDARLAWYAAQRAALVEVLYGGMP